MSKVSVPSTLHDARRRAGLTQQELAQRAGTSQPAVAAYEAGRRTPTLATLERMLAACGQELVVDARPTGGTRTTGRSTLEALRRQREAVLEAAADNGVTNVRVFGSVARREADPASDVDLLVDLEPGRTLVDLAAFREDALAILGTPVDVATPDVLKPSVREEVLREALAL